MQRFNQAGALGALLLAGAFLVYGYYELVLWPAAGFPTNDVDVILAGAPTLRISHWLKFVEATGLALLLTGIYARLRTAAPLPAQLASLAGVVAVTLLLASGMLGLRILAVATRTYPLNATEAITTIYLRTVTYALFDAAGIAAGLFGLLFSLAALRTGALPRALCMAGLGFGLLFAVNPLLSDNLTIATIVLAALWCLWLAAAFWREPAPQATATPAHA